MYNVGKWFRKRYRNLIGDRYSYLDIKMESSDYDRSLMSAECFLAGFYPPNEDEMWHEELKWQPIPVHAIPLAQDNASFYSSLDILTLRCCLKLGIIAITDDSHVQELRNVQHRIILHKYSS